MNARKIVGSVFFNYLGSICVSLTGFVATPILLHSLGKGSFGAWALIGAIMGYASLLDLGIGLTVMRMVAQRAHLSDRHELNRIASTGLVMYSAIGLVALAAGAAAAPFVGHAFNLSGPHLGEFTTAFVIMVATIGLTFPAGLYTGINQGFGHYAQQNVIVIVQSLAATAIAVVVVKLGGGLVSLAIVNFSVAAAAFAAKIAYAARAFRIVPSPRRFDRRVARTVIGVSAWMFVVNVAARVIWDVDAIVVGAVLSTVAVAQYAVALGPATAIRRLTDQFNSVSLTAASSLHAQGQHEGLRRLLIEATRVVTLFVCPFLVLFAVWGTDFLRLWVGPSLEGSAATLVALVFGILALSVQATATQVLLALGRQRIMSVAAVLEACVNLTLSIVLAHHIGILGVALGTTIPTSVAAFGFYIPYAARLVGLPLQRIYRRLVLPVAISALAYGALRWAPADVEFGSLVEFMCFAGAFVGVLIVAALLLDREERGTYLQLAHSVGRRVLRAPA
ncbi:MAG: hypothetical protein E6G10_11075 [Actinobacteria bacterium]|nr:MAG: hypothetical protein E6G10_11075 [Actinomycetota bacterium]